MWRWYPPKANQKLGSGWIGPYEVLRKLSDISYEIKHVDTGNTVIVHVDHLKAARGRGVTYNYLQSQDTEMDSAETISDCSDSDSDSDVTNDCMPMPSSVSQSPSVIRHSQWGRRLKPVSRYSP